MENPLLALERSALSRIVDAANIEELEAVRVETLGRKGALNQVSAGMGKMPPEQNAPLPGNCSTASNRIWSAPSSSAAPSSNRQHCAPNSTPSGSTLRCLRRARAGSLHPVTQLQREIEDLFSSLGFAVLDGPEVETEYNNFDALNIPPDHPARDMQDTFWVEGGYLLRTHTSAVQVRGMGRLKPPMRMIAPGRVFRNESVDASHEHTFYQLEGMMIDREVSVAHLTLLHENAAHRDLPS